VQRHSIQYHHCGSNNDNNSGSKGMQRRNSQRSSARISVRSGRRHTTTFHSRSRTTTPFRTTRGTLLFPWSKRLLLMLSPSPRMPRMMILRHLFSGGRYRRWNCARRSLMHFCLRFAGMAILISMSEVVT